jgi:AraC-like DNA-binding protein
MCISRLLIQAVVGELRDRGIDPYPLVDNLDELLVGVSSGPGMSPRQVEVSIERLCAQVKDPGFGLLLGQEAPETMLHVIGHLMLTCETVLDRFRVFERYASLFIQGVDWTFEEHELESAFGFTRPPVAEPAARFIADWILTFALNVGRAQARDARAAPVRLLLSHRAPTYADRYGRVFGCPVLFDQPKYSIVFPTRFSERRQPHADPLVASALRDVAEGLYREATGASSFVERVRHLIAALPSLAEVDFDALSQQLGLSPRSLRRRLTEEGQSLSALLEEARCRRARDELSIYDESIDAIAERLGYADSSSFHRAFKRWTGQTPFDYRKSSRGARSER